MKTIIIIAACSVLILFISIPSCKKDKSNGPDSWLNHRPIAKAGDNVTVQLVTCNDRTGSAELDGSGSFDPDSNIVSYKWIYLAGQPGYILHNANSPSARVENISSGEYAFELIVTDKTGLFARDTVKVITTIQKHNLDITFNGNFRFIDNYHYSDFYYDYYLDSTEIIAKGNFSPSEEFNINMREFSDSSDIADAHYSILYMYKSPLSDKYIFSDCSINFKKIIKMGGGSFSGTLLVSSGSASNCHVVFSSLAPLSITGNLDTALKTMTCRIQGQVYF